uniref:Uncharacterized protein n=1 Tax=Steinernema glaseri TaxID=37863 RepID=A0A1I8A955_9BILA
METSTDVKSTHLQTQCDLSSESKNVRIRNQGRRNEAAVREGVATFEDGGPSKMILHSGEHVYRWTKQRHAQHNNKKIKKSTWLSLALFSNADLFGLSLSASDALPHLTTSDGASSPRPGSLSDCSSFAFFDLSIGLDFFTM